MVRKPSSNRSGGSFSELEKLAVWRKGKSVFGYSPDAVRADMCGKLMKFTDYGLTTSPYGWEIDHILPVARGGSDLLDNLQPLQWENNRRKGDSYPWYCAA